MKVTLILKDTNCVVTIAGYRLTILISLFMIIMETFSWSLLSFPLISCKNSSDLLAAVWTYWHSAAVWTYVALQDLATLRKQQAVQQSSQNLI